jgi:hypothetical protein
MGHSIIRIRTDLRAGIVITGARASQLCLFWMSIDLHLMSSQDALGFPLSFWKSPQRCPTNVFDVASRAWTGTMMIPHRMVLNTPQAVAYD